MMMDGLQLRESPVELLQEEINLHFTFVCLKENVVTVSVKWETRALRQWEAFTKEVDCSRLERDE